MSRTKSETAVRWVERYCVQPSGPERGQPVKLTAWQRDQIAEALEGRTQRSDPALNGYLALLKLCGPRALAALLVADIQADSFTVWNAAPVELRAVLKRRGERIVCPELRTQWPSAAA